MKNKKSLILMMVGSNVFRFGCAILAITLSTSFGGETGKAQSAQQQPEFSILPFGENGVFKMLYDRRMRPQAVCMDETVYIVFNQGVGVNVKNKDEKSAKARPMFVRCDLASGQFSKPVAVGPESKDHHYSPIIWSDTQQQLHILHGCHKTPGSHIMTSARKNADPSPKDWLAAAEINPSMSYPSVYNISNQRQVIYFRNGEHRGNWRYLISDDQGKTWKGPSVPVIDLNLGGENLNVPAKEMDETSSYQSCFPSKDGKSLHVAFCHYDDNKESLPEKFYNPRYKTNVNLGLKYNLYYVKIDLETDVVRNFDGQVIKTPIDLASANATCKIWDTGWRGTGVPPDILLDDKDHPSFLHVLTEDNPETLNYYYVSHQDGKWTQTVIRSSNHEWNSGHLTRDETGNLHAYLLVGESYLKGGPNDKHGGGAIEEWISKDEGKSWFRHRDLTPDPDTYKAWRFNNIQPVRMADGKPLNGVMMFYGWPDANTSGAKAFLLIDKKPQENKK